MAPRPILKAMPNVSLLPLSPLPFASCSKVLDSPHVHFPPTPTLVSTATTHSPFAYDRAPIPVSPNACALPERGGRVYTPYSLRAQRSSACSPKGSYFHPQAFEVCEREALDDDLKPSSLFYDIHQPPLIPDLSSESDDSDMNSPNGYDSSAIPLISVHLASDMPYPPYPNRRHHSTSKDGAKTLSFLLHTPPLVQREGKRIPSRKNGQRFSQVRNRESAFNEPLEGCLGGF